MPDRTLLLTLPGGEGDARARARDGEAADRFAARGDDFHRSVAATFDRIADSETDRVRRIDASGDVAAVTARLIDAIADLLP